jgi:hypothetical protein
VINRTQRRFWSFSVSLAVVSLAFLLTIIFPAALVGFTTFVSSIGGLLALYLTSNVAQKKLLNKDDSIKED